MSTRVEKMLAEHDPGQTLLQQVVGGFLAIIAAMAAWIAKLRRDRGLTERRVRQIIQEELEARQFGRP